VIPVPTLLQLASFSGRDESSYTGYAESALIQACLQFTILTEISADDFSSLAADDMLLATQGILAYADYIYLQFPYQQVQASPLEGETIGSYTYSKPPPVEMRNVQAQELGVTMTGVHLWDLALQYLSKRQRAAGVFYGEVRVFDRDGYDPTAVTMVRRNRETGELELLGPMDLGRLDVPMLGVPDINAENFPMDPG
jgi:hypothetical protein